MLRRFTFALGMLVLCTLPTKAFVKQICHSPEEDCINRVVKEIDLATKEVLVQAYGFTSCPIIEALARANSRGANVRILLDKINEQTRNAGYTAHLRELGIEIKIDHVPGGIAHKKTFIIDRRLLISGSLNPTRRAPKNVEVVYFIVGKAVRADEGHWWKRDAVSQPTRISTDNTKPRCQAAVGIVLTHRGDDSFAGVTEAQKAAAEHRKQCSKEWADAKAAGKVKGGVMAETKLKWPQFNGACMKRLSGNT